MFGWLSQFLGWLTGCLECVARFLVGLLLAGLTELVNLFVAALMLLLSPILALLPDVSFDQLLPDWPWLAWINYMIPLDYALALFTIVVTVLLAWRVVSIGLRWLKVIP